LSNCSAGAYSDREITTVIVFDLSELIHVQDNVRLQFARTVFGGTAGWPYAETEFIRKR
jgi:hypothetical protein